MAMGETPTPPPAPEEGEEDQQQQHELNVKEFLQKLFNSAAAADPRMQPLGRQTSTNTVNSADSIGSGGEYWRTRDSVAPYLLSNSAFMKSVDSFIAKHDFSSDCIDCDSLVEKFQSERSTSATGIGFMNDMQEGEASAISSGVPAPPGARPFSDRFKSTEWALELEQNHVDIDPTGVFDNGDMSQGAPEPNALSSDRFKSTDWARQYEEGHVDVDPTQVFDSSSVGQAGAAATAATTTNGAPAKKSGTDFFAMYFGSLPSANSAVIQKHPNAFHSDPAEVEMYDLLKKPPASESYTKPITRSSSSGNRRESAEASVPEAPTNKRKQQTKSTPTSKRNGAATSNKNKNKKDSAEDRVYSEPTDRDVLLGRGGRTNHHPGNAQYLREKEAIQPRYLAATKDEKTGISQELVDRIHSLGGRFLELDSAVDQWFEVPNIKARKKASQTLRELNTAEERAAKRKRYGK